MRLAELRRRIAALTEAVNPAGSVSARLAKLGPSGRASYQIWRDELARHAAAHPGAQAYERLLAGDIGPALRSDIRIALFGPVTGISTTASLYEAQAIYRREAFGE